MPNSALRADVVIIGGGLGGCAAALAAARLGRTVLLTEETDWLGGQLTSQAVPPDEHPWIEQFGCTRLYRQLREGIRAYYRQHFPLSERARRVAYLNPGNGWVSRLCHEPRVALAVLEQMLAPFRHAGRVRVLLRHRPVAAEAVGDRVRSVTVVDLEAGDRRCLEGAYIIDATETGELLPLAGVEYVTGAESQEETGEPHAPAEAHPLNMQAITWCFALDYVEGEDHTIERPADYEFWRSYRPDFWPDRLLSWTTCHPRTLQPVYWTLFGDGAGRSGLWTYRRLIDKENFAPGTYVSDISLINWPQNDYWLGPVYEVDEAEATHHLQQARQLSLCWLYWLQTEAPRPDGGVGYPGLRLRADVVGTRDGLAKYPYIRESRRIRALFTVLEQHIAAEVRGDYGAERYPDSVGVGCYRIDLHPSTGGDNYIDIGCWPFQIPLGALIPIRVENLLPAAKNIGTTHITNGCYRLHPVEWNIGEAAGYLAAFCLQRGAIPRQVREDEGLLRDFQNLLRQEGVELEWPRLRAV